MGEDSEAVMIFFYVSESCESERMSKLCQNNKMAILTLIMKRINVVGCDLQAGISMRPIKHKPHPNGFYTE